MDSRTNGLSWAAEKMKSSSLCAIITAEDVEGVRSKLATEGATLLRD